MQILVFLVVCAVLLAGAVFLIYNHLVRLRVQMRNAFSQIDVQLKRRHELVPNLVNTARGYLEHERETLESVMAARGRAVQAGGTASVQPDDPAAMAQLLGAEQQLGGALGRLLAVMEAYPDLKADQTMRDLMEHLTSTDNRIAFARQAYNDAVMSYNTAIQIFPNVLLAGPMGFRGGRYFETAGAAERQAPQVAF